MSEQLFLRDDIIQFTHKLDSECYNIKAYRKRKSKSKKLSLLGALTTDIGRSQDDLPYNKFMDKAQLKFNKLSERRTSMTAAIKNRPQASESFRNFNKSVNIRTQINSHKKQSSSDFKSAKIYFTNRQSSKIQNINVKETQNLRDSVQFINNSKYGEIQQNFNKKGPANNKVIENWLNQILIQYCHQENFDKSIQNSALKKMSLDRNSLLSQGINPQHVNRVYKSMFVYSIGFNNLLKQIAGKNTNLKKTIWKVYAILLQFCSQGSFQTMIGQIQRDKAKKIQSLREQIEKRQRIIQNNDQVNAQKNAKIFKQLKVLRQENTNLQNQKNVLMEDFKQAQQSFNHQVSLRLKFQNKINQIHGIHNELATKHSRLYDDYHKKVKQFQDLQFKFQDLHDSYLITKQKLGRTLQQLTDRKNQNTNIKQIIQKYQNMRMIYENSQIQMKNSKQDLQNIIKEKLRKISQLQLQLENSEIMFNLSKSSTKQLQDHYKQSLADNRKLHATIHQQTVQINQLFNQKKKFNQKHMSYVAEIQFLKNKDSQNKINLERNKKQLKQQKQKNDDLMLDKLTLQKKVQNINKDLNSCYQSIQNMKKTKNIFEEQLIYYKKRTENHGQIVKQKDILIKSLTKSNQKLSKQNQQLLTLNKGLDSRVNVLTQKLSSQQQINKRKIQKLKQQRDILLKQNSQHNAVLQQKLNQLQKYMNLYDKQMINLKNQRFQRLNLDFRYKQSLQVMQNQNQHIRNLNIKISQNYEEIQQLKRKIRNIQYVMKQKQHLFDVQRISLKLHIQQARKQIMKRKMYVHPMLLEDVAGLLKRAIEKCQLHKKQYDQTSKKYNTTKISFTAQLQREKQQHQQKLKEQQDKNKKIIQQKQYQLEYQKQKSKHIQQKLQEYQKIVQKSQQLSYSDSSAAITKDKQRKYLQAIKQKSDNIEKLYKQLQTSHDHNNTLVKRVSQMQSILSTKNQQIMQLDKKIAKINQEYQKLQREKNSHFNNSKEDKDSISQGKFDQQEQGLQAMNHTNNHNYHKSHKKDHNQSKTQQKSKQSSSNHRITSNQKEQIQSKQLQIQNRPQSKKKQRSDKVVNPAWRNDFGKKLKNSFNYYQK